MQGDNSIALHWAWFPAPHLENFGWRGLLNPFPFGAAPLLESHKADGHGSDQERIAGAEPRAGP